MPTCGNRTPKKESICRKMLSTTTIPFELPEPGVKIAVKVIDQTGMEHMTVIDDPKIVLQKQQL